MNELVELKLIKAVVSSEKILEFSVTLMEELLGF